MEVWTLDKQMAVARMQDRSTEATLTEAVRVASV